MYKGLFNLGDKVRYNNDEDDEHYGEHGTIVEVDEHDEVTPYYVDFGFELYWVNEGNIELLLDND